MHEITLKLIILSFYNIKIINFNIRVDKIITKYLKHDSPRNFLILINWFSVAINLNFCCVFIF